jgi:uncharacterized membrane protein HdeD (DUF308 family)
MVRSVAALLFGLLALAWPQLTLAAFAILFGMYAVFDGMVVLTMALTSRRLPGCGSLRLEAVVAMLAGFLALVFQGFTPLGLLAIVATWAIMTGLAELASAAALRDEMSGEWPLPLAGTLSLILGLVLILRRGDGVLAAAWMISVYALISGASRLVFAVRMRQLAHEMANA